MSRALGAVDRRVDPDRRQVRISGSEVRRNPFAWRHQLNSRVYRDLVVNVAFLGAPSTGKTTLAERLAREFDTCWMPEYGREVWERQQVDRRLTHEQLVEIARGHLVREDALLAQANCYAKQIRFVALLYVILLVLAVRALVAWTRAAAVTREDGKTGLSEPRLS